MIGDLALSHKISVTSKYEDKHILEANGISWQYNNVRTNTILHTKHLHRLALAIHLSFCERKLQDVNVVDVLSVGKCLETSTSLNRGFN